MKFIVVTALFIATISALPARDDSSGIQNRIAGGDDATPGQFPFQVGISTRKSNGEYEYNSWCGGSLVSDQLVVTAAHCLHNGLSSMLYIGATDLSKDEPGRLVIEVPKKNLIVHENYIPNLIRNDIALVKLPQRIEFNELIQPVNLPRRSQMNEDFIKQIGWISGWGKLGDAKGTPQVLQYTRRWILPFDYCDHDFGSIFQKDTQVCIDGSHGISACQGDSGGPLTVIEEDGTRTLVGATSYGKVVCEQGNSAVYTRITAFLDWIAEKGGVQLRD